MTIFLILTTTAKMFIIKSLLAPASQVEVHPAFYTMQPGDFPCCITHHFNLHNESPALKKAVRSARGKFTDKIKEYKTIPEE